MGSIFYWRFWVGPDWMMGGLGSTISQAGFFFSSSFISLTSGIVYPPGDGNMYQAASPSRAVK